MNTPQSNPAESLNQRFVVFMDGNPKVKPASGTAMASAPTDQEALERGVALRERFPERTVHFLDTETGRWGAVHPL